MGRKINIGLKEFSFREGFAFRPFRPFRPSFLPPSPYFDFQFEIWHSDKESAAFCIRMADVGYDTSSDGFEVEGRAGQGGGEGGRNLFGLTD